LFQAGGNSLLPTVGGYIPSAEEPLEARVATISAEIAAAIVQAQTRIYEEEEDSESGSGHEMGIGRAEMIRPNTSGIRDDGMENESIKELSVMLDEDGEDDDSDAFPIPLRTRKAGVVGSKRKR
jgi:hypothetical protein